jgi:Rap1a immunity proteins
MRHAIGAMAVAVILYTSGADADISSNQLHTICQGERGGEPDGFCYGYIVGVEEFLRLAQDMYHLEPLYCPPEDLTDRKLVDLVRQALREGPQLRDGGPASGIMFVALSGMFPCK